MAVNVNIYDKGQSAPISTLTSTLAWIGVSSAGGTPGTIQSVYQFSAPGLVNPNVGYGPGAEGVAAGVRVSETTQVFVRIAGSIPGSTGSVAQTGSSPLITLSGTPYDSATPALQITHAGPLGTAQFQLAMDGSTFGPVLGVPAQVAAGTVGTVDLSAAFPTLNTLTLLVTPSNGSPLTVTFATPTFSTLLTQINNVIGPATVTGDVDLTAFTWTSLGTNTLSFVTGDGTVIPVTFATPANQSAGLAAINTALGAHGVASVVTIGGKLLLRIADAITGVTSFLTVNAGTANTALGLTTGTFYGAQATIVAGKYLSITDGTQGLQSQLIVGAGTANTALGLVAGTYTGAPATYVIPFSGITITFPVGTYTLNETYTWSQTEPRFTASDISTAVSALQNAQVYFRDIVLLSNPIDGIDTRALSTALGQALSTMRGSLPKVFAVGMMAACIATPATITANDTAMKLAMQGMADDYVCVTHGDCYMQGTATTGSFRRPLVYSLGIRESAYPISDDPGDRENPQLEETSMIAPDLVTQARNEDTAVVKMASAGFTTARSELGAAYFVSGITRSTSPKFMYLPIIRTAVEAARTLYSKGRKYENASRFLNANGTIRESDAVAIETYLTEQVNLDLANDISGVIVTVDRTGLIAITNTLNISADIQHLAYFYTVNVSLGVVDILS